MNPCSVLIYDTIQNYIPGLPVVAFRFSDEFQQKYPDIQQKWIQTLLRAKGWIVPNYELAPDLEKVEILRVVVRENMSEAVCSAILIILHFVQLLPFSSSTDSSLILWRSLKISARKTRPHTLLISWARINRVIRTNEARWMEAPGLAIQRQMVQTLAHTRRLVDAVKS